MSFGLGCKVPQFAPHLARTPFRMHASMIAALPSSVDLRETGCIAEVKDQGPTGSCEGHSSSGATQSSFALLGDPLGFVPSEEDIYGGARSIERARSTPATHALPKLQDEGALTEDVIAYMATFGIRPRLVERTSDGRNSDVEASTVNEEEGLAALERAATHLILGPYAIDPHASDAEHQLQAALFAKIPVRVDSFVDTAYMNWTKRQAPAGAPNAHDPNGGGHAQYIVGYATVNGVIRYFIRNSWGRNAGDNGDFEVSSAFIRNAWGLYPWAVRRAA